METKVNVVKAKGRKFLILRWTDPLTGRVAQKSAKTNKMKEAERLAGKLQAEINEGRYSVPSKVTWAEFRERFEEEHLPSLATRTRETYVVALNQFATVMSPHRVMAIDGGTMSRFQARLRERGLRPATIAKHLRHLKGALRWAKTVGLVADVPHIKMPKQCKGSKVMRGRPIMAEEFDRMLAKVGRVVGDDAAPSWRFYLEGMWRSGLRLSESLQLYWDRDDRLTIDFDRRYPMLRIAAAFEKGKKDRVLPIAPEFAELLEGIPMCQRAGRVFKLIGLRGKEFGGRAEWVSKVCSRVGKAAGIKVDTDGETGKLKFASLHDLRRSFGRRWAERLGPQQLRELMRHESLSTTMEYYVGQDAERTATAMWETVERSSKEDLQEWG